MSEASPRLRVAVVSDIHAASDAPDDTYVATEPPVSEPKQHPLADLLLLARHDQNVRADILLCPGDLTNRSDDAGKVYGWRMLNELADALGAQRLIASPGNHDLQTHLPVADPAQVLKNFTPSYPSREPHADEEFWRDGFDTLS